MRAEPDVLKSGSPEAAPPAFRRNPRRAIRLRARPVQANMDPRKPGTSPPKDLARVRARLGPGPAGGPARKAKGGVRGSAAEGGRGRAEEKKTKNSLRLHRTHQ